MTDYNTGNENVSLDKIQEHIQNLDRKLTLISYEKENRFQNMIGILVVIFLFFLLSFLVLLFNLRPLIDLYQQNLCYEKTKNEQCFATQTTQTHNNTQQNQMQ